MARLLVVLLVTIVTVVVVVSSRDNTIKRGEMQGEPDDQYSYDEELNYEGCGGPFDNGLKPECQSEPPLSGIAEFGTSPPTQKGQSTSVDNSQQEEELQDEGEDPEWCDVQWCSSHIESCKKNRVCPDGICKGRHPNCDGYGCPCPQFKKKDFDISVSCDTSQSVLNYDLSKLSTLNLNISQLSISVSMRVSKYFSQIST